MKNYLLLLITFIIFKGHSQKQYPKDYFSSPLNIPIVLSGTFGELRSNHFHSGIDIKTQGKEGIPIVAPADGYVSRIKVGQYGYGKALYVNHPNGYTTVYAHLQKFGMDIQQYVKKVQYKKQSYQTGNLFPKPDQFLIKKGEVIGYTGDTGGSNGPHLHYEIRNTKTERIINPLHFGMAIRDTRNPTISKLMAFPLDDFSRINQSSKETLIPIKYQGNGTYTANKITANGFIGFGVHAFDKLNGANNKNGLYSLEMKVNGSTIYYHDVETFSFSETKFINLLIDYKHYRKFKRRFQKTHRVKGNKLSIYENLVNDGKLLVKDSSNYNVEIIAKDFENNTSKVLIPVQGVANNTIFKKKDTTAYKVITNKFTKFSESGVTIAFPKNSFYKDVFLDFSIDGSIAKIHDPIFPLRKRFTLTFDTSHLSEQQQKDVYIADVTKEKYPRYVSTKKKKDKVYSNLRSLGSYTLKFDTEKPTISFVNFKNDQWISALPTLKVKIKDSDSGIKDWKASIDGKWILMEYNHKKGILTYDFSDIPLKHGKHRFEIAVSDKVGNIKKVSAIFFRK